jgi:hypothetical protein
MRAQEPDGDTVMRASDKTTVTCVGRNPSQANKSEMQLLLSMNHSSTTDSVKKKLITSVDRICSHTGSHQGNVPNAEDWSKFLQRIEAVSRISREQSC